MTQTRGLVNNYHHLIKSKKQNSREEYKTQQSLNRKRESSTNEKKVRHNTLSEKREGTDERSILQQLLSRGRTKKKNIRHSHYRHYTQ